MVEDAGAQNAQQARDHRVQPVRRLEQLIAVDCAYIGAIAVLNFLFPYILVPVAFNPAQLLVPPSLKSPPPPPESAARRRRSSEMVVVDVFGEKESLHTQSTQ